MKEINIKIENRSNNQFAYEHGYTDSGMDVRANIAESITLKPLERKLIPTGLFVEISEGYEIQVRPRSGLALKRGITVLNAPGTVDANYRGEIGVILINLDSKEQVIEPGERIAQLVVAEVIHANLETVDKINTDTVRGESGFGGSGRF